MTFGFIITRHVNSEQTNKYWNQNVKLIRTYYPLTQIIIIDDNSNSIYVKADYDYKNIIIIQSEYPGRGELLPYIYFLKYKWFEKAVIIHDSTFIHSRINFEKLKVPVLPLWHHNYDKENLPNLVRISSVLNNNVIHNLLYKLNNDNFNFNFNIIQSNKYDLCFGVQSFITLSFLELLESKYGITKLINVIKNRTDRCGLERIMGLLFCLESPLLLHIHSLFGDITTTPKSFNYSYNDYVNDLKKKRKHSLFVKVWTGR